MPDSIEIKNTVRNYILENLLDASSASELTDSTPLITGGILDSVSTLKFIAFLEQAFHIEFQPEEVDQDNLNTIGRITEFVQSKMA
jgi:acyl carrier protein